MGLLAGLVAVAILKPWWPEAPSADWCSPLLMRAGLRAPDRLLEGVDLLSRVLWPRAVFVFGGMVSALVVAARSSETGARVGAGTGLVATGWAVLLLLLATSLGHLVFPWTTWAARAVLDPVLAIGFGALGGAIVGSIAGFVSLMSRRVRSSI
jgi:hypothetical protein